VVCLAPRALRNCAPLAPSGASVRPLNFTVRSHLGEINVAKSRKRLRLAPWKCQPRLTGSSCRRLRSVHQTCACGSWARSALGVRWLRLPARCRTRTVVICEGDF